MNTEKLTTPVVFIIFNRPDLTQRVFDEIRRARPAELLVISDAPRPDVADDAEKCALTKAIIEKVDWPCKVTKKYETRNLGVRNCIGQGLNWAFSQVDEAIVLEADCLPDQSFFFFCQELLARYRDDRRIMHISGDCFLPYEKTGYPYSYFFSKTPHTWGWATWRRAWQYYDVDMKEWPEYKRSGNIANIHTDDHEREYWTRIFDKMHGGEIDTWDYQWHFACLRKEGMSVLPGVNLISNIGFGRPDSIFCIDKNSPIADMPLSSIREINHPPEVVLDKDYDISFFEDILGGNQIGR